MCVWCIVGASNMCSRQHVASCLWQHAWNGVYIETWSASPSRLTLAYPLPTACPNKALNRLERLRTPKGVLKWTKNLTQLVLQLRFRNNLFIFPLPQSFWKRKFINNLKKLLQLVRVQFWTREEWAPPNQNGGLIYANVMWRHRFTVQMHAGYGGTRVCPRRAIS